MIYVRLFGPLILALATGLAGLMLAAAAAEDWGAPRIIKAGGAVLAIVLCVVGAAGYGMDLGDASHGDRAALYRLTGEPR